MSHEQETIAGYMLDKGYPIKEIADMVKLPQKEIKEIASKKKTK